MPRAWVLVADSSRARLFAWEGRSGGLEEVRSFSHPDSRVKRGDLISTEQGRYRDAGAKTHKSAMPTPTDPKEHQAALFARELASALEEGRKSHSFERLYVAAPPSLLGKLRALYSGSLSRLVREEIDKNLVALGLDEIRAQLPAWP